MNTTVGELMIFLEELASFSLQECYDNSGHLVGNPQDSIKGVLIALDMTEAVIEEAIKSNCNVVLTHHPIIFSGLKRLTGETHVQRVVMQALKNDINLIAIHTNLDNVLINGVNEKIASKLGLEELSILLPKNSDTPDIGAGIIGTLSNSLSRDKFLVYLKTNMQLDVLKYTKGGPTEISKIAICGGSGRFLLEKAKQSGAHCFVSSDFKYHEYFEGEQDIMIADIGHYESEKYTIDLLYDLITNKFSNFAARKTSVDTNPIKYYS